MDAYTLITPARNEADYITGVIQSVTGQSLRPVKWVIVSDGSTDETDDIVVRAANKYSFIEFARIEASTDRSFASKACAFSVGYEMLKATQYRFVGNLDADVTLPRDYYMHMIDEMSRNPLLGVASGVCWDLTENGYKKTNSSLNHAVGAVQFWRRECFEAVGGYRPVSIGGTDSLAELTARMKGWETRSFADLPVFHHKPVDSVNGRKGIRIAYRSGLTDYYIGNQPVFAFLKAIKRWRQKPLLFSVLTRILGYCRPWLAGSVRDASDELVAYLKQEQRNTLRKALFGQRSAVSQ